jgi:hypothetical protein
MPAIFISHSSRDNAAAAEIKAWLTAQSFEEVFLDFDKDSGLGVGDHWERRLYEAIERCQAVIAVVTPAWLASKWCFAEFTSARAQGKSIFPIILTPDDAKIVGPELRDIQAARWDVDGQEQLRRRLVEIADELARGHRYDPRRPPWPGILAYDAEDAAVFFGRDPEIRRAVELLETRRVHGGSRMLWIVGASGSGKSSLMKAGILPLLRRDKRNWIVLPVFRPGVCPLSSLAKSLAEALGDDAAWLSVRERLKADAQGTLSGMLDALRIGPAREATAVVPIDQLEETWSLADEAERSAFVAVLQAAGSRSAALPLLILATIRSDRLNEALQEGGLAGAYEAFTLSPMPLDRLASVVRGPSRVADLQLESGLVERVLADVQSPEALPLLAFALRDLYERFAADKQLRIVEYESLGDSSAGLSAIENAIRRKAEDVIGSVGPSAEQLAALKETFVGRLTRIGEDGSRLRRSAPLAELPAAAVPLIERLIDARLLTVQGEQRRVEVAHEALFAAWPQLDAWLDEEADFLAARRQLEDAESVWRSAPAGEKGKALLHGLLLERARAIHERHPARVADMRGFLAESFRRRTSVRRRQFIAGLGAAAILGGAGTLGLVTMRELQSYRRARQAEAERDDLNGYVLAYSTSPDAVAMDGAGENSPFTTALLERLGDPSLSVSQMLQAAVNSTVEQTVGAQRPEFTTNINGELFLHEPPAKRRTAVVTVGVGKYDALPTLKNPPNDARAVAAAFQRLGYDSVELLIDPTLARFEAALEGLPRVLAGPPRVPFGRSSASAESFETMVAGITILSDENEALASADGDPIAPHANTVAIVFFAGQGVSLEGESYLSPADASPRSEDAMRRSCLSLSSLLAGLQRISAVQIVILDTCRDNPFKHRAR